MQSSLTVQAWLGFRFVLRHLLMLPSVDLISHQLLRTPDWSTPSPLHRRLDELVVSCCAANRAILKTLSYTRTMRPWFDVQHRHDTPRLANKHED